MQDSRNKGEMAGDALETNRAPSRLRRWRLELDYPSYFFGLGIGLACGGLICQTGENGLWLAGMGLVVAAAGVAFQASLRFEAPGRRRHKTPTDV